MRLSLFALVALVGCAPAPASVSADVRTSGHLPVPMVFLDRAAMGAVPNVGLGVMGVGGDRTSTILGLESLLYGAPVYLGVIACTTGAGGLTNHTTGAPFNNTGNALCGKPLLIQPSAETNILPVTTNSGSVSTITGVDLLAKERVVILMTSKTASDNACWLACITPSGTSNLSVWELH